MPLAFLLVGISWDQFPILAGPDKAQEMEAKIRGLLDKGEKEFIAAGYDYRFVDYSPDEGMERFEGILKEKDWAGVAIGAGIRMTGAFTPLFERLVNSIHEHSPKSKILFNTLPDNTLEAVGRWFPAP